MDKKLIFLDIDGTLSVPRQGVSPRVLEALKQARGNGHKIFVCTGRNKVTLQADMRSIPFDGWIISAGAYIELDDKVIVDVSLSDELVKKATNFFDEIGILYNFECNNHTYMNQEMAYMFSLRQELDETNPEMIRQFETFKQNMNVSIINKNEEVPEGIKKMTFLAKTQDQVEKIRDYLKEDFDVVIHKIFSDDKFLNGEIIPKSIGKGKAIRKVVEVLGADMSQTIGFGDSMNDYEMIVTVAYGVCMANGSDDLKAVSDKVCESVYDDGIYHEFKRLGII